MKKILILCTGNSCRSIIAEAMVNNYLENISAFSAGAKPAKNVHPFAKKVLIEEGIWSDTLYSKSVDNFVKDYFDMVLTVCDNAKETCPIFPNAKKIAHFPLNDPDGKPYNEFVKIKNKIKEKLLPFISHCLT